MSDEHPFSRYRDCRIVVLGASGFLGRWVARALSWCGAELYLVVRRAKAAPNFECYDVKGQVVEVNLADSAAVRRFFRRVQPTITFNLAGYGVDPAERDDQTAFQINTHLLQTICHALVDIRDWAWCGLDIVHVGSALEYGAIGGNLAEDSRPNPTTLYGRSKLAGTLALASSCRAYGLRGITARLFTVYGPGEHAGRLLPSLLAAAQTGQPLALTAGTQQRDFIYVEDAAEGLLRLGLARSRPGEIVNLATGQLTPVRRFVESAAEILQLPADRLEFGTIPLRVEEMEHDPVTIARLRRLVGWAPPTPITAGIRRTVEFGVRLAA
ncbi:MAG: dTDP-6-deoxy-L-talose 4-dehydrogenase (NAD(P)(+)) [Anaerolineae bacterium]|nr:dTDP-6-deoxy-L-talose 4-dehydrogenase (NAD(P)(+)) [Anaerolineae bacterium]